MNCTITTRDEAGVTVFDISGRMSFPDPHLQKSLGALLQEGRKSFILNLEKVTYVDSYGLHDLVTAYNAARNSGGKVALLNPTPNVRKTIEITMKGIFEFFEDEPTAIAAVR